MALYYDKNKLKTELKRLIIISNISFNDNVNINESERASE